MSSALEQNFNFFLDNQFDSYKEGEWVAIYDKEVISHGTNLKQVIKEAKKIATRIGKRFGFKNWPGIF